MYGLDLRDTLWGENPMGARRLLTLVSWLPTESATQLLIRGYRWTQEDELLATAIDQLQLGNHYFLSAHIDSKKTKLPDPKPFPRPWEDTVNDTPALSSVDDMRAFFADDKAVDFEAIREDVERRGL